MSWIRIRIFFGLPDPDPSVDHQAKIVIKTWIPTVWLLLDDFLSLKNDINVALKSNKLKKLEKTINF